MKLIKYTLLFASIAILTSCEKDYLNTSPTDSKDEEIVYDNTQNLSYAVNGLAKLMTAQHLESQGFKMSLCNVFTEPVMLIIFWYELSNTLFPKE